LSDLDRILSEAAEKIRQEAYAAGWRDALAAISLAIAEAKPSPDLADFQSNHGNGADSAGSANVSNAPTVGTTPHYVFQAVRRRPGMTGAEVVAAVYAEGHNVGEPQIRTALSRLAARKLLVNRHKKWFPV
jgi:hypothetical protein